VITPAVGQVLGTNSIRQRNSEPSVAIEKPSIHSARSFGTTTREEMAENGRKLVGHTAGCSHGLGRSDRCYHGVCIWRFRRHMHTRVKACRLMSVRYRAWTGVENESDDFCGASIHTSFLVVRGCDPMILYGYNWKRKKSSPVLLTRTQN
jgi:hypothetical protein